MSEEVAIEEVEIKKRPPIRIECPLAGHEEDYLLFHGEDWKFKHLRLWETLPGVENIVKIIVERIVGWDLHDDEGKVILFNSGKDAEIVTAFDEFSAAQAAWVTGAFRQAYLQSGMPSPPN